MKKIILMVTVMLIASISFLSSQELVEYGYFTYVENDVKIKRLESTVPKAMINVPVVPGDVIKTGENGRCEIQFNNGTVMRLDNNSELKVETILANMLTSRKKLTTLKLNKGNLYAISKTYRLELFQVLTPFAAVKFNKSSTSLIEVHPNRETSILVERGRVTLKYGIDKDNPSEKTIRPGVGMTITKDHKLAVHVSKPVEFLVWNETINKHYDDIHHGVSKIPKPIYRYPKAVIYFAEKWSSMYGEWIYDDLFGYVWRPYHESFAYTKRPFFNSKFENINGKLFLVPDQPWGWAPAHLGTWVWMGKKGWVWIPGNSFHSGVSYENEYYLPQYGFGSYFTGVTFYDYCSYSYGGMELWKIYINDGLGAWRRGYYKKFNRSIKKPNHKNLPVRIRKIFAKMKKMDTKAINNHINRMRYNTLFKSNKMPFFPKAKTGMNRKFSNTSDFTKSQALNKAAKSTPLKNLKLNKSGYHDFNPDRNWARRTYQAIYYSPKHNSVVVPSLNISSHQITPTQRSHYFGVGSLPSSSGIRSASSISSGSSGSSSSGSSKMGSSRGSSGVSRGNSSGGNSKKSGK